ncbi:MAG TPA: hypothetical protein VFL88_07150 [Gemmatimonadales bacterium]|nr:hypothetical protein [Gemmatimonadales bacterium]
MVSLADPMTARTKRRRRRSPRWLSALADVLATPISRHPNRPVRLVGRVAS